MPTTTNRRYEVPVTGTQVGTWGDVLNANFDLIDNNLGGVASISTTGGSTVLSAAQYKCGTISVSGALTTDATLIFPAISGWWTVSNRTSGSSRLFITITGAPGELICIPQRCPMDIFLDGTNVRFRNLPPIGSYLFLGATAIPTWITGCTVPPYLYCNGTTFSSGTYPILAALIGGTTLPDLRGRGFFNYDDGTGRITTAGSGINGNVLFNTGGAQNVTISTANVPQLTVTITDPGHTHPYQRPFQSVGIQNTPVASFAQDTALGTFATSSATTGITAVANSGSANTALNKIPPLCIGGISLIRAG